MKKGLLLLLLVLTAGCGGNSIVVRKFDTTHIRHVSDLGKLNVAELGKYCCGYLEKGDIFPLELKIDDERVGIKQKSVDIEIKQRLYFLMKLPDNPTKEELERLEKLNFESMSKAEQEEFLSRYMLYLGSDAEHWAPIYDGTALKQVLGFKMVSFSFGVGMDKDKGVISVLTLKTEK